MRITTRGLLALAWLAVAAPGPAQMEVPPPWREAFDRVYRLNEGEVLRRIPAPFIPERDAYYQSLMGSTGRGLRSLINLIFEVRGTNLELSGAIEDVSGNPTPQKAGLLGVSLQLTRMRRVDIVGDEKLLNLPAPGDWVRREGATRAEILEALGEIMSADRSRPIRIVRRPYPRRSIVVRGRYRHRPLPGREGEKAVHVYLDKLDVYPTIDYIFDWAGASRVLELTLQHPIVDETLDAGETSPWFIHHSDVFIRGMPLTESQLEKVLENLSRQTSLDFTIETRMVMTWVVEEKKDRSR